MKIAAKTTLGLALGLGLLTMYSCAKPADPASRPLKPIVSVVRPQRGEIARTLVLPGDVVGYYETALHAKVTGYLKHIWVDKGDTVKKGQLLAEIEVPELKSNFARAKAGMVIAKITYTRLKRVQESDPRLVSQEDVDMAYAKYRETQASMRTLATMISYTQIVAPFTGVITGRFADPGALIRAGGNDFGINETSGLISPDAIEGAGGHRTGGGPILTLADIDKLRVYVYVPEGSYPYIKRGTQAVLRFDEFPNRVFKAPVARFAKSLDLATRTMLAEIDISNPDHLIYPRSYVHVTLDLVRHPDALIVPVSAVQSSSQSSHVLVVKDGRIDMVPISTGINNGRNVEVTSGLTSNSVVVSTYSNTLNAGEQVRVHFRPEKTAQKADKPRQGGDA